MKYIAAARYACNEHITKHGRERPQFVTRSNREHLSLAVNGAELELTAHRLRVCPIRSGLLPLSSIRKTQLTVSYKKKGSLCSRLIDLLFLGIRFSYGKKQVSILAVSA
ncbi:MAG: hypothetical protein Q4D37_05875 [Oscillospiraceae bacterium]|nr:hypothetical protein [Oscillospiraceae bacterium]